VSAWLSCRRFFDTPHNVFLLMLRCERRVSEVSHLRWAAIDMAQGTLRVNTSKGQVDRVVSLSPDMDLR
jgi:integrase